MARVSLDRYTCISFQGLPGQSTITRLHLHLILSADTVPSEVPCGQLFSQGEAAGAYVPLTNTEVPGGEAVLPAVLVIFSVENLLFVLFRGDVALPLLLTVTVLPTHPAVEVHLKRAGRCAA